MNALTEKDARTKWCPFAETTPAIPPSLPGEARRYPAHNPGICCIASDCMAWQWLDDLDPERGGYCGLAER